MRIRESTRLAPQRYTRDSGDDWLIEISSDGIELDLAGAVLDGETFQGFGVYVHDCDRVVIRNGLIKGFRFGIRAERVRDLRIESNVVSDNYNPPGVGWLDDTAHPNEEGFGGGVYVRDASKCVVDGNELGGNFNGLDLVHCSDCVIQANSATGCGNVGIHLLGSSRNTVERNRADRCIRFAGRFWNDTADSAGILLEEYSDDNRIVGNTMRYGGDGFFIRANNGHASNGNYVARNDGSFSPNNAFEAVFSERNTFEDNVAEHSNYGFWLGYSRGTVVRNNRIRSNRLDGVAIEHGIGNTIEGNEIAGNLAGVRLWADGPDQDENPSRDYMLRGNVFRESRKAAVIYSNTDGIVLEDNTFEGNAEDVSV